MRVLRTLAQPVLASRLFAGARAIVRRNDGVAAVEFALVLPFLVTLGLGVNEVCRYVLVSKRTTVAAASIAQMVASTQRPLDVTEIDNFAKSVLAIPNLARDSAASNNNYWNVARVNVSSIRFKPSSPSCVADSCPHDAHVLWSWGDARRACGRLTPASDLAEPTPTTIPTSLLGPGSVISVEVNYLYVPVVGSGLFSPGRVNRSAYFAPRNVPYADLAPLPATGAPVTKCTGV